MSKSQTIVNYGHKVGIGKKEVQEICNTGEDNGDDGGNSRMK